MIQETFKLNDSLDMILRNDMTYIRVNGKELYFCKRLIATITPDDLEEITKIDQIVKYESQYNHNLLSPKEEFWGHCSNLQVWVESKYNPDMIHTRLGLQVLYHLIRDNDSLAVLRFQEMIHKKYDYKLSRQYIKNLTHILGVHALYNYYDNKARDYIKKKIKKLKRREYRKWLDLTYPQTLITDFM